MNEILRQGHELFTEGVNKTALSAREDKRIVLENGKDTLSYVFFWQCFSQIRNINQIYFQTNKNKP